jgi:hypothetical protein
MRIWNRVDVWIRGQGDTWIDHRTIPLSVISLSSKISINRQ